MPTLGFLGKKEKKKKSKLTDTSETIIYITDLVFCFTLVFTQFPWTKWYFELVH